ncbi:asparagine synthase-related protein [Kitasatospora sp. NPDC051853]|uniref:asparagine synthase-related protein n=1 Tax=Kitasatospora sp. NPDC051853 TaxID=3364058 RepID=UPI0037A7B35B
MRWLTGWCGSAPGPGLGAVRPIAATVLWPGVSPLWAVGDWRPDEIRLVTLRPGAQAVVTTGPPPADPAAEPPGTARLAVLGRCGASDAELAAGLATARGGAVRHLTTWPGSYTAVLRTGPRSTVLLTDLAGVLPVFHTPYEGGTAYATAALPLADLVGAPLDTGHLAARLACPESPEALGESTPYLGVRRVPPGHLLGIRNGRAHVTGYEPEQGGAPTPREEAPAVRELTRALLESVRCRVRASRGGTGRPRLGADLSYGTGSATVALLAAAVPIAPAPEGPPQPRPDDTPAPRNGAVKGSWARPPGRRPGPAAPERLTAVTLPEEGPTGAELELPRLRQLLVPSPLPYAELAGLAGAGGVPPGPLTDEPGTALVAAARLGHRFEAGGADHLTGYGARQVLDGHPARLADLVRAGRARRLAAPVAALTGAERAAATGAFGTLRTPLTVWRAAHRLARARYAEALDDAAVRLTVRHRSAGGGPGERSAAELAWCVPGPAARWLSDDALSAVALRLRLAARGPVPAEPPGARRARQALHRHAAEYRTLLHAAEQQGQRLHAPFLDNQVVRAARLLPDETRLQPGARHALLRAVLAGATRTDLPPGWGPRPDRTTADLAGLHLAADGLAELFRAPLLAEAGLIDLPAVHAALASLGPRATDLPPDTVAGLAELVSTELWLRRIHARRHGSAWTGLPLPHRPALARPA